MQHTLGPDPPRRPSKPSSTPIARPGRDEPLHAAVRAYWEEHVTDWPIARAAVGSRDFFRETEAYRFEKLSYLDRLVDYADYAGRTVLDVGCGLGNDTARFAAGGARVTGIDVATRAVELTRRNFEQRGLVGRFHVTNGEAMDLADASFDLVYCHTVLHFTPEPARMIGEIHRVLKPGGEAILMMVNRHSWMRLLQRISKVEIDHLRAPVFHWYTAREFRALLRPFVEVDLRLERFPVRTKVHRGLRARLFNLLFVDLFGLLPRRLVGWSGHHMIAFARKAR